MYPDTERAVLELINTMERGLSYYQRFCRGVEKMHQEEGSHMEQLQALLEHVDKEGKAAWARHSKQSTQ